MFKLDFQIVNPGFKPLAIFQPFNPYLELLTPPVIKVPEFSGKSLWFFLYKILQLVYPPLWPGGFHENP